MVGVLSGQSFKVEAPVLRDLSYKASMYSLHQNRINLLQSENTGLRDVVFKLEGRVDLLIEKDSLNSVRRDLEREMLETTVEKFNAVVDLNKDCEKALRREKIKNWIVGVSGPIVGILIYELLRSIR